MSIRNFILNSLRVFLLANLLLLIANIFYPFQNFMTETILSLIIVIVGLIMRRLKYVSFIFLIFYYAMFLYYNTMYVFILGLCLMIGLLVIDFIKPKFNVWAFVYMLIPLFILGHVLWFADFSINNNNQEIIDNLVENETIENETENLPSAVFNLDVGSINDNNTNTSFHILNTSNMSQRLCNNETCYRVLNGSSNLYLRNLSEDFIGSTMYINLDLTNESIVMLSYSNISVMYFNFEDRITTNRFEYLGDNLIELNGTAGIREFEIILE